MAVVIGTLVLLVIVLRGTPPGAGGSEVRLPGPQVHLGIGVHYGEAVLGSIGDAQRLDYVVVGDTVNVASRLERLTRALDVELVASDAVVGRIREEGSLVGLRLEQLKPGGEVHLTGRMQPITIWTAGRDSTGRSLELVLEPHVESGASEQC